MPESNSPVAGDSSARRTTRTVVIRRTDTEPSFEEAEAAVGVATETIRKALEFELDERTQVALTQASCQLHAMASLAGTQQIAIAQHKASAEANRVAKNKYKLLAAEHLWNFEQAEKEIEALNAEVRRLQQENRALRLERGPEDRDADLAGS